MYQLHPFCQPFRAGSGAFGCLVLLMLGMLAGPLALAQADTEIFLVALGHEGGSYTFGAPSNLTRNPGYDNQPAFPQGEDLLLYARTRNGQTDIVAYNPETGDYRWVTDTPGGSEYSPLQMPGAQTISAIRLDTTGLQRLYAYTPGGEARLLFEGLKIGYTAWAGPDLLVCTVLVDGGMDLVVARPSNGSSHTFRKGVGRSLQRIPGTDLFSYTEVAADGLVLKSMNPVTGATGVLVALPNGVQDVCWLPDGSLLCGGDGALRRFRPGVDSDWQVLHRFYDGFGQISRLAVNDAGTLLAIVVEQNEQP